MREGEREEGGREAVLSFHHNYIPPIGIGVSGSEGFVLHKSAYNLPRHSAAKNIPIPFINCKCYIQTKVLLLKMSLCCDGVQHIAYCAVQARS